MEPPRTRRAPAFLLLILTVGVALRLVFASGFVDFDDRHYIERAFEISVGRGGADASHHGARMGLVAPTAALFAVFGVSVPATVAVPFLCSLIGLVVAFAAGRALFDERTGLVAAALLALFPLDVIFAACLSPTAPIGLFAGAAMVLFVLGERARRAPITAAAGLALGAAFTFGETPLFLFVAYAVWALSLGRPGRRHLAVLLGFAGVVVAEMIVAALLTGDPLGRFTALAGSETVGGVNADVAHAGWNLEWLAHPLLRIASEQELGLYLVLGLPLAMWRLARSDDPSERTLALFAVVLFAWISYGTVSPFAYAPLARLPRYFSLFQIPLMLLLALWLLRLSRRRSAVLVAALAATSLICIVLDGSRWRSHGYEQVHALLARDEPSRVVVEAGLLMPFLFFEGYDPAMPVFVLRREGAELRAVEVDGIEASQREAPLAIRDTYVVARAPEQRRRLAERRELALVRRFPPPDTLYRRLLRSDGFRRLLGSTRSRYRMRELEENATGDDAIEVYVAR